MKERIIIDTSVFTNPDTRIIFGKSTREAFCKFLELVRKNKEKIDFYMPPSIFEELSHFLDERELPGDTELVLKLKAPKRFNVQVPGFLLYELIEEIRARINRGLRVAEEALRGVESEGKEKSINRLRNKYREALRSGIIDSKEDVDLILLALELDGAIVTSDEGVKRWAEKLGIRLIQPKALKSIMEG